jgi:hypothetical protein
MPNYETLDRIADAINPILGVLALVVPWLRPYSMRRAPWAQIAATLMGVALAYVWQAIDAQLNLWSTLSLDYSTHTAVCTVLGLALWQLGGRWRIFTAAVGVTYATLMVYQRYHTAADIATTMAVVLPTALVPWRLLARWGAVTKTA